MKNATIYGSVKAGEASFGENNTSIYEVTMRGPNQGPGPIGIDHRVYKRLLWN